MVPGKLTLHGKALLIAGMNKKGYPQSTTCTFYIFFYFDKTSWMCNCSLSLWFQEDILQVSKIKCVCGGGGEVLESFFDGVCTGGLKPLPISKDFSPSKNN